MAEVAAAAIAAEQVVATGLEAAAAVAIAAPTLPLKISLTHLPNPAPEGSPHPALARSHHSLTVLANKAFIFGGLDASNTLCPPGIHTITLPTTKTTTSPPDPNNDNADERAAYTCYPPYPLQDPSTGEVLVPAPRAEHAACARAGGRFLLVHGGRDAAGHPVGGGDGEGEGNCLWQWDCEALSWEKLRGDTQLGAQMAPRWGHWLFAGEDGDGDDAQRFLVLVGGKSQAGSGGSGGETEREAWMYDLERRVWTALPGLPARPLAAAYVGGRVYIIAEDGGDKQGGGAVLGGVVHYLDMRASAAEREKPGALAWESVSFPANPLAPGPKPRTGGALVPLSTGHGREYLVYGFGCSEGSEKHYFSDIWTLQLPARGRSAAAAKDTIRDKLPRMESGEFRWDEAEIVPIEQVTEEGKVHPGPRGLFGADRCLDGQGVVLWGGINAKEEKEGDGWLLRLAHGYADNDRWE
ncbi:hypothetical protein NEMBOFW57_004145 [Staphylotrichum longicolle]|uniref:Uncharacterized protein n=1 Tax=Staphylotrichum longicolle TaxID=669026 RepID=A0AAD4FB74_9PEZI|nr:hypothetical protein NEMBOFW57_004145 [Staphylotrichum longicolle]